MKVPWLKVHVMTDKTLKKKLDDAKAEGKNHANKQIETLLHRNAKLSLALRNPLAVRNPAGGKKRK